MNKNEAWIETHSGIAFHPFSPRPEEIESEDIAHALSQICRFTGHTKWFYSVAQHCIICAELARLRGGTTETQLRALLHDASEAYICDISRPVKQWIPQYHEIEDILQRSIYRKFGLAEFNRAQGDEVKSIDDTVLHMEARILMPVASWATLPKIPKIESLIVETPIGAVKGLYLKTLSRLLTELEERRAPR